MKRARWSWRLLAAGLAGITVISSPSKADTARRIATDEPQGSADLSYRAKSLRGDLDEAVDTRPLTGGSHGTDVSDVVLPYIPPGTSFADAQAILRSAGFTINPYPDLAMVNDQNRSKDWYAVLAEIPFFRKRFLQRIDLYVSLFPRSPGDYSEVVTVVATILVTGP